MGALTQLYAGTMPETRDAGGKWFIPWAREAKPHKPTEDAELAGKLWEWLDAECKKF